MRVFKIICFTIIFCFIIQYKVVKALSDQKESNECVNVKVADLIISDVNTIPVVFCEGTQPFTFEPKNNDVKINKKIDEIEEKIKQKEQDKIKIRPSFFDKIREWLKK